LETLRLKEVKALAEEKENLRLEFEALQSELEQKLSKAESQV
jgi:chaperonin cofactor prefoldin